ncbi:hypothetical protein V0U79_05700 [Hyphobacterium sp. HN65]|uniref:Uncharacterized protein n=1 Tax=Hyphobacterium lacteum TaxID=3116575 RepID=A0ABU7LPP5_9PROT|nr:hypothetical protein [Hyphobacterium sp. HN65]MEE2525853.1 hypothetical protein [Hyphobacterium sp. HN65]
MNDAELKIVEQFARLDGEEPDEMNAQDFRKYFARLLLQKRIAETLANEAFENWVAKRTG